MSRFEDAVRRVKNMCTMNNVYDCARPILLLLGLVGIGATRIRNTDGVYTLHNTRYTTFMTVFMSLDRVLQIIHNVDSQLEEVNIRVKHWPITLKVALLVLLMFDYEGVLITLRVITKTGDYEKLLLALCYTIFNFVFVWVMLFVLIIHERFVGLTKVLQQDATVTTVHVVGERGRRDNYRLRRVQLARHVHEQLTEAVQLFSDSCRYAVMSVLTYSMLHIIRRAYALLVYQHLWTLYEGFTAALRIVGLTYICQANKNERRVRTARIRHLLAFETDREIIQQLQQYTMYNAFSPPAPMDFQFSDINNVLLFAIIDVVVSNILIIYSYTR